MGGPTPRLRGILFDLDDTLHSRESAFWAWIREEAAGAVLDLERVATLDTRGRGSKPALLEYLASSLGWREASLEARMQRFRAGIGRYTRIAPEVHAMLARLRQSHVLGLVSNGLSASQRPKLQALQLEAHFDPILISEEVGFRKPQPEIFQLAVERWRLPPEQILMVGDDPTADIQGALAVGLHALRVLRPGEADPHAIGSVTEVESWLQRHGHLG